jgi:hypothetical protein
MDWRVLVKLRIRTQLPDLYHLANLFVANEQFVNFLHLFFKHEVLRVLQNLFTVKSEDRFPYFLIQGPVNSFTVILIETLKVASIDIDPFCWHRTVAKIIFDFTGNILAVNDFHGFFLPIFDVIILVSSDDVFVGSEK